MEKDYYKILGLSKSASEGDIKSAYRKLAMEYHPDKNPGNKKSEERFKEVAAAYETLKDPKKRSEYDAYRSAGGARSGGFSYGGHGGARSGGSRQSGGFSYNQNINPHDIFNEFFGDIFGQGHSQAMHKVTAVVQVMAMQALFHGVARAGSRAQTYLVN